MPDLLTYSQVINSNTPSFNANLNKVLDLLNNGRLTPAEFNANYSELFGYRVRTTYTKLGKPMGFGFTRINEATTPNPINSNASTISRGTLNTPLNTTIDAATQTMRSGKILPPSGAPSTWSYVANSVASPIIAAGVGISLGKTIDSALYNLNPNFWDSNAMSAINPETWNSLTTGIDYTNPVTGTAASLMNMIFGLNPETGETTAYIDENAYALMAQYLYNQGAFSTAQPHYNPEDLPSHDFVYPITNYTNPLYINGVNSVTQEGNVPTTATVSDNTSDVYFLAYVTSRSGNRTNWEWIALSENYFVVTWSGYNSGNANASFDNDNSLYYAYPNLGGYIYGNRYTPPIMSTVVSDIYTTNIFGDSRDIRFLFSNSVIRGGIDGIGNQQGAQFPDVSTWNDPANILPSLQFQYPDVFDNPIEQTTVNPDGTTTTRRFVPIPLPNVTGNPDTQPTSGEQTQQDTKADIDTSPDWLTELIAKLIQQPDTAPFTPTPTAPENPIDTGEGESPVPVAPVGSASALWSIYHPTQAQINAFGGWLWSADFIEQLKKIFNNPMESIIGLHKVYATPIDAGTSTIHVGYLDSEVPSAYITQQYITVNCGSVNLLEQFGNVFDYGPFTSVKLYLPFIGIVNLDVSEVMRSMISIKYGVDVITGACLAMVSVSRDGNNSVLYQFAGNCAVQYPLSMGSYMGIVSSVIGIAGSIAATMATGGSVAPLAIGAIGGAMNAHTSVQNSSSFSGNAGAMGGKKPYLIIERPQTRLVNNQQSYIGTPTNEHKSIGSYSGFVKFRDVHLTGIAATDEEISQIQSYLTSGVII